MDAVSELMEQGEHRLAVNRRRWRRNQGALEALPLHSHSGRLLSERRFGESANVVATGRNPGN